jgi:uncharacterized protein (TIGR03083 family)
MARHIPAIPPISVRRVARLQARTPAGTQSGMRVEHFSEVTDCALGMLRTGTGLDWSARAGSLDWSCRETADHMVDVIFSYAFQIAAGAERGYLPFAELHALLEARPDDLVDALNATTRMFRLVMDDAAPDARAWHALGLLSVPQWAGLGANEVTVHTFDIAEGLHMSFEPPASLCEEILHDMLALHDSAPRTSPAPPCAALLEFSGRPVRF